MHSKMNLKRWQNVSGQFLTIVVLFNDAKYNFLDILMIINSSFWDKLKRTCLTFLNLSQLAEILYDKFRHLAEIMLQACHISQNISPFSNILDVTQVGIWYFFNPWILDANSLECFGMVSSNILLSLMEDFWLVIR